jgi:hypothetical protein
MKNPVEVWVCLEPLGQCGLWYLKREYAERTLGTFTTIVPVMLPWELYSGIAAGAPVDDVLESDDGSE